MAPTVQKPGEPENSAGKLSLALHLSPEKAAEISAAAASESVGGAPGSQAIVNALACA